MDLSSGFDSPNPYGLRAADFEYDMDGYDTALRFLSDLAGGSTEEEALRVNGGNPAMLRAWESNTRFRRVLAKCRAANARELADAATRAEARERQATEGVPRFIPLEEAPVPPRSIFSATPNGASWGSA